MYNDLFYINKNFQSSINLELDLNNERKINEYIPTTDICDVLKKYIKTILGETKDRATTLVGPYGKGKSFLLLILNYLLSNNKDSDCWNNLVLKIKNVDVELYDMLIRIKKENISLLTIIINSNYDNIKQSFQLALSESLKRENLNDIIPNTVFDICLDLINKWESDEIIKNDILKKCLDVHKINLQKLKNDLETYSYVAYKKFEDLYNCINIGLQFNPLISNDVVKIYKSVADQILTKGYSGFFIVFDEFSKFLESNSSNLMLDLKLIQDFAELSNSSNKKSQINLCCVTHKSVSLYLGKNKRDTIVDGFKTVEGRFKEIKFNRSLEENYQLISSAIYKYKNADEYVDSFYYSNKVFYDSIYELGLFSDKQFEYLLCKGCFPLNPLTVYSLINLSEIVAQNERTLFTFLSDSNEDSLNSFICNYNSGLFNVDKIYDYFRELLQKEEANFIRNIWYRAESLLAKLNSNLEKKIIKVIAIILMINDYDKLPCTEEVIALSLCVTKVDVEYIINSLIEKHYLRRNLLNNLISFALSNSKHIDESIEVLSKTKFKNIKYSEVLEKVNDKRYVVPRMYNEQNKMTRFYSVVFMQEDEFELLYNFDLYFENRYCDGLIINLLTNNLSNDKIIKKISEINDPRVVVKSPIETIEENIYNIILRYACLEEIKVKKNIDEISMEEINLLIEENEADLLTLIDKYFNRDFNFSNSLGFSGNFNEVLSNIMDHIYSFKLIFNNELINKKTVSSQYLKAISHVVDYLLNNDEDFNYSDTSPEAAIKYSIIDSNESNENFRNVIDSLKNEISNANGQKLNFKNLLNKYISPPYGIREGVLPIIVSKAISELSDNVILYINSKEIELNALNLIKAIINDKYSLSFSKSSSEQLKYLNNLMDLFEVKQRVNFRKDIILLTEKIKKYFLGLPKIIRMCSEKNNYLNLETSILKFKSVFLNFNINPYEALFDEPKRIFNEKRYKSLFKQISSQVLSFDEKIMEYKNEIIKDIKNVFVIDSNTSLKKGIDGWLSDYVKKGNDIILSEESKKVFNCIRYSLNFDDVNSVDLLCNALLNSYVEDWDKDRRSDLIYEINKFINCIKNAEHINENTKNLINFLDTSDHEYSQMALMLKDAILSTLEGFADSVETSEKISILKELIKNLL